MPLLIDEEDLHRSSTGVDLSEDGDEDTFPPKKRMKLEHARSEPEGTGLLEDPDAVLVDLTASTDDEDELAGNITFQGEDASFETASVQKAATCFHIRPSLSNFPRSLCDGWEPPMAPTPERTALEELLCEYRAHKTETSCTPSDEDVMIPLRDFRVYRPTAPPESKSKLNRQYELEPLHHLTIDIGCDFLLFDGIISIGSVHHYVERIRFDKLAIEGYGDTTISSVKRNISIQSFTAASRNVWYLLEDPSPEYLPYHVPFLWVADFAKHTIDYLSEHEKVTLDHFRSHFCEWLSKQRGSDEGFQNWLSEFGRSDFRQAMVTHANFLWKECWDVAHDSREDPLWVDIHYIPDMEPAECLAEQSQSSGNTLLTPYVFRNFQHISPLTKFFEAYQPKSRGVNAAWEKRKRSLGFIDAQQAQQLALDGSLAKGKVERSDFVVVRPDEETLWKDGSQVWFAYVQDIRTDKHGELYDVIWLYSPSATTLAGGKYPYPNELFLSSHCNCEEAPLRTQHIIGKVNVHWLKSGTTRVNQAGPRYQYFIRQMYDTDSHSFATVGDLDFCCRCARQQSPFAEVMSKFAVGDTFLVPFTRKGRPSTRRLDDYGHSEDISDTLEPVVLDKFLIDDEEISVRRLLRRGTHFRDSQARPNELVWTDEFLQISPEAVGRRCSIRFFKGDPKTERPPAPYCRNGSGNCWIITAYLNKAGELEKLLQPHPTGMNEGFDPQADSPRPQMIGLDAFAGGGNFGRGLEEGGAVTFVYAIDWAKNAVLTYKANRSREKPCWVYWGSVNDYLRQTMNGSKGEHFARVGDIDFIAAGTPCQGFSSLQRNKASDSSLRNISMVASVAAYVDFYRPKYALLENVVAMAHRKKEKLGVFPQLLCALVGLGYQVSQHFLDAWSCGDSQKRARLFISIAAPGLVPMPPPTLTHSHPPGTIQKALGKNLANDLKFGERRFGPTPFQYVSVEQSMGDLPNIGDSHIQTCIPYPDHRTVSTEAAWTREMLRHIPIYPPAQGVMNAILTGTMPQPLADRFLQFGGRLKRQPNSLSWSRIPRHGLTNTITTAPAGSCAINGRVVHWQQHRVLTIREARRAQGFDDDDVITGSPGEQWKIVGNSVSRSVALSLGMALREAWLANPPDVLPARGDEQLPSPPERDANRRGDAIETSKESSLDEIAQLPPSARVYRQHVGALAGAAGPGRMQAVVIDLTKDN